MERKRAAILAADVVGFSRLMGRDEEATVGAVRETFSVLRQLVEEHHGEVFGGAGDSMLAQFPSLVQAIRCATEIQKDVERRTPTLPGDRTLRLRIGVNFGEILMADDGPQGNSISLAVRIEGLADPGGVVISQDAYMHLRSQDRIGFEDAGEHRLRGFSDPVRVYRMGPALDLDGSAEPVAREPEAAKPVPTPGTAPGEGSFNGGRHVPVERPVLVVLPFDNLSVDPEQEYFCHGLAYDITTELSRFPSLSVISSTTATHYKDRSVHLRSASRDLGARFVLEGSVQKTEKRVRINVQLLEAKTDSHIWAERFDRDITDLFSVQDEIVERVVAAMALKMEAVERSRAMRSTTTNPNAYDAYLKGSYLWLLHLGTDETKRTLLEARHWLETATNLDPNFGRAWAWLSLTYLQGWLQSWSKRSALEHAGELAKKALVIDSADYNIHWINGYYYLHAHQFDLALSEYELAVSLNKNDANLLAELAEARVYAGDHEKGQALTQQAMRMYPNFPEWYRANVAWVRYLSKDYAATIEELNKIAVPNTDAWLILAAAHAQRAKRGGGADGERAKAALHNFAAKRPGWTIAKERRRSPFRLPADLEHWLDGLRRAGLPN